MTDSDLATRIQDILKALQLSSLATITTDGKPWVRYVMMMGSADMTIRCASFNGARKVEQIAANPNVHVTCGVTDPRSMAPYLQVQGQAAFTTDEQERHSFWHPALKHVFSGPDDPHYGVIVIRPSLIEYCIPGKMEPEVWQSGD